MGKIVYDISVNSLIEALEEYECVKIEFYENGDFAIMDEAAPNSFLEDSAFTEYFYLYDFEGCNGDIGEYIDWLEYVYKYDEFYVNWVE